MNVKQVIKAARKQEKRLKLQARLEKLLYTTSDLRGYPIADHFTSIHDAYYYALGLKNNAGLSHKVADQIISLYELGGK